MNTGVRIYSEKEVAELVGFTDVSVANWRKTGVIPPAAIISWQKPIRYDADAIDNWIASGGVPDGKRRSAKPALEPIRTTKFEEADSPGQIEELIRGFWSRGSRAVDVLMLPPEEGTRIASLVNDALEYMFRELAAKTKATNGRPVAKTEKPDVNFP